MYLQSWSDVVLKQKLLSILHFISRWVVVIVVVVCFTIPSLNSVSWWCKKLPRCTTVYSTVYRLQQNMCNVQWLLMLMHGQEEAGDMVDTASSWQPTSASSSSLLPSAFELSSASLNCHQWRLSSSLLSTAHSCLYQADDIQTVRWRFKCIPWSEGCPIMESGSPTDLTYSATYELTTQAMAAQSIHS